MSYYYLKSSQIGILGDDHTNILICVTADLKGRGKLTLDDWSNGWIITAGDGFDLYVKLKWNQTILHITDEEYNRLKTDRVVFFSKERTLELRKGIRRPGAYDWTNQPQR